MVIDELPTISVQGLDGLMATARSNKVAVVLGIQDLTQVKADYGDKVADKILALPANVFVGASSVTTAEKYSKEFGKEFRRQESQTRSVDSESVSISYHEEEVMPIRKITSLPQGTFIGKVAIENDSPITQPFFCGAIQIDMEEYARKEREAEPIPDLADFDLKEMWERLRDPVERRQACQGFLQCAVRRELRREKRSGYTEEEVMWETNRRLSSMTDGDCDVLIREMLPGLMEKEIAQVIEQNFLSIRADINDLILHEYDEETHMSYVEEIPTEEYE